MLYFFTFLYAFSILFFDATNILLFLLPVDI